MALDTTIALIDVAYLEQMWQSIDASTETALAEELINQASALAETWTKRKLKSRSHTEIRDGNGRKELILKQWPVTALTSVHIDAARTFAASTEVTANCYYDGEAGELYYEGGFGTARRSVQIVYTAGYTDVPNDLKEATIELVSWLWHRQRSNNAAIRVERGMDGVTTEHAISIPMHARQVLESYRRAE
jgi:hypothetical protein